MADIALLRPGRPINNGSVIIYIPFGGSGIVQTISDRAVNTPLITDIENKYSDRWDDNYMGPYPTSGTIDN